VIHSGKKDGMTSRTVTLLEDDIDGSKADETVQFALDGTSYQIDLTQEHAAELRKALETYINHARHSNGRSAGVGQRGESRRERASRPADTKSVRAWAESNNIKVSKRGRIPAEIVEQYRNARH